MVIDSCPVAGVFALLQPALGVMGVEPFCSPPGAAVDGMSVPLGMSLGAVSAGASPALLELPFAAGGVLCTPETCGAPSLLLGDVPGDALAPVEFDAGWAPLPGSSLAVEPLAAEPAGAESLALEALTAEPEELGAFGNAVS